MLAKAVLFDIFAYFIWIGSCVTIAAMFITETRVQMNVLFSLLLLMAIAIGLAVCGYQELSWWEIAQQRLTATP